MDALVKDRLTGAEQWELMIPNMNYMALLRNLRGFDEAGVSDEVAATIIAKLTDPEQVAKSRQLPMRFLSAYKNAPSLRWAAALERALQWSLDSVPSLPGRSLILWDCSGSMYYGLGGRSTLDRNEVAGVFCSALALRAESPTLVQYGTSSRTIPVVKGGAVLKLAVESTSMGATNTWGTVRTHFSGHDRIIIVTDEQAHDSATAAGIPDSVPVYTWNVAGYEASHIGSGKNRFTFGGLSDKGFNMIAALENGAVGRWPWEA